MYINASRGQSPDHLIKLNKGNRFNNKKSEKLNHFSFSVFNLFFWSNSINYQNLMQFCFFFFGFLEVFLVFDQK